MKKEIIKLLDAGIIYPISDSTWVPPIHCVPKKGGITVIKTDKNECEVDRNRLIKFLEFELKDLKDIRDVLESKFKEL